VAAQFIGRLGGDAAAVPFQIVGANAVEQTGGQRDGADQRELGQLLLHTG